MKKIILIAIFMIMICLLMAAEPIAYLIQSKGNVQLLRDRKSVRFKNGELLFNNDEIKTAKESFAAVKYNDGGAAVRVFPNSVMRVTAVRYDKQQNKNTLLNSGSLYSKISSRIKGSYQVETPNTVASVKGTGYIVRYGADKITYVIVLEGEVLVQNKESGKTIVVGAGNTATSEPNGNIEVNPTGDGEITDNEMSEIDATNQDVPKTLKVPTINPDGTIKYIEISY